MVRRNKSAGRVSAFRGEVTKAIHNSDKTWTYSVKDSDNKVTENIAEPDLERDRSAKKK